jgi:SAM-dependent methyltransferase
MSEIREKLISIIECPNCRGELDSTFSSEEIFCRDCGYRARLIEGKPMFTDVPQTIRETEYRERGPGMGTPWRQANWLFLEREIERLAPDALVLDVGAGRGDFSQLVGQRPSIALDIYPYPEVDLVCDLTKLNPFREKTFDAVVLMNVLEHVFDTRGFLDQLSRILKPGGKLFVAIPFLLKEHQAPFDFVRYTQFALREWGAQVGLLVETLEGYYDPMFLIEQGTNNLKHSVFPQLPRLRNYAARLCLFGVNFFIAGISTFVGKGNARSPEQEVNPAPIGYHLVYLKPD